MKRTGEESHAGDPTGFRLGTEHQRCSSGLAVAVVLWGVALRTLSPLAAPAADLPNDAALATATVISPLRDLSDEHLARIYCQACHLFPSPQLLNKQGWQTGALVQMAPRLGVARIDLKDRADAEILKESGIFPTNPILPEEHWLAVCRYYLKEAPSDPLPQQPRSPIRMGLRHFKVRPLQNLQGVPFTCLIQIDSTSGEIYVGDAGRPSLSVLDSGGTVLRRLRLPSGPVSLTRAPDGEYLTLIGRIFPSDETVGSLIRLQRNEGRLSARRLLDTLRRPTDTVLADLNQDGRTDLLVCQFGNRLGRFSWFENLGQEQWREHVLLDRPGAVRSEVRDFNGDDKPDILVLLAQALEGVSLFLNQGDSMFEEKVLIQQSPAFGYSSFQLADFDRDGQPDLLTTNGDNGDYIAPMKSYHGVRIYRNVGEDFGERWFFPLNGAYQAQADDFDADGDLDIAAVSFFPDYRQSPEESFVYFENVGPWTFVPHSLNESLWGRWLTLDAGDVDGDGDSDIVLGSFAAGPATIPIPAQLQEHWRTNGVSLLLLENTTRTRGR